MVETRKKGASTAEIPADWDKMLESLSEDSQTLVKILNKIISDKFTKEFDELRSCLAQKDEEIMSLKKDNKHLQTALNDLEMRMDELEQYSRRDCVVFTGPDLPPDEEKEITTDLVIKMAKEKLNVDLKATDISVSHRLGKPKAPDSTNQASNLKPAARPIIVKLVRRSLKYDLTNACIKKKASISVNESLTPRRLTLMRSILAVRKQHKQKFKQCYSSEGRIFVLLHNSMQKFCITSHASLMDFLGRYPNFMDTYEEFQASRAHNTG